MLELLQLLQLADSALPIGAGAHSFGLETLSAEGDLAPENVAQFFFDLLIATAPLDAVCCRRAYQLAAAPQMSDQQFIEKWTALNWRLSARKPGRESRTASATLGKRLLRLVAGLERLPRIDVALETARLTGCDLHHCTAMGLCGGALHLGEDAVLLATLQQNLSGLLSACQRLMPVGQMQMAEIGWRLKPLLVRIADSSRGVEPDDTYTFAPLLDLAAMRHAYVPVRLFVS